MKNISTNTRCLTVYQLSLEIKEDYRALKKIISDLEQSKIIDVVGNSTNSHRAKIYGFSNDVIEKIKSELQAKQVKSVSGASASIERDLKQIKDLQLKVIESENTIKSLNNLISNKDKEIQTLINANVRLDADTKIKDSEIKLITEKSKEFEKIYFEKEQEVKQLNNKIKQKNYIILSVSAILLVFIAVAITSALLIH